MNESEQLKAAAKRRDLDLEKDQPLNTAIRFWPYERWSGRTESANLGGRARSRSPDSPRQYRLMTTIQAATAVLSERKPLTTVELAIESVDRGHRSFGAVLKVLRASLNYHSDKYWQDAEGRWGVVL